MFQYLLQLYALFHSGKSLFNYAGLNSHQSYSWGEIERARKRNQRNKAQRRR
jgi:hypothetical protein